MTEPEVAPGRGKAAPLGTAHKAPYARWTASGGLPARHEPKSESSPPAAVFPRSRFDITERYVELFRDLGLMRAAAWCGSDCRRLSVTKGQGAAPRPPSN